MSDRAEIEILFFDDCPNYRDAIDLVRLLLAESHFDADLKLTLVEEPERARELRFLGSPTIRVNGRDVEPGADEREDYVLACRVYQTEHGPGGVPDPRWIVWGLEAVAA
ncbi:MAG: thioredoxin family protein [Thermoleophilia bacterium]|nr:thioredoxin family protein [Thermoleophilia bacterium]